MTNFSRASVKRSSLGVARILLQPTNYATCWCYFGNYIPPYTLMILFASVIISCFIEYAFTLLLCRRLLIKAFQSQSQNSSSNSGGESWHVLCSAAAKSITKKDLNKMWKDKCWERGRRDSVFHAITLQSSYDPSAFMWFAFCGVPNKFHSNGR